METRELFLQTLKEVVRIHLVTSVAFSNSRHILYKNRHILIKQSRFANKKLGQFIINFCRISVAFFNKIAIAFCNESVSSCSKVF